MGFVEKKPEVCAGCRGWEKMCERGGAKNQDPGQERSKPTDKDSPQLAHLRERGGGETCGHLYQVAKLGHQGG